MRILISQSSDDERAAALLKELIERCSLRRIEVWFSSDRSGSGGIALGEAWFTNILQRLSATDAIVALITPKSMRNPWLYYECGYLANKGTTRIIPLTLGLPVSDIPAPLSIYQGHDLSVPAAVDSFLKKIFSLANVVFDEEMTKTLRDNISEKLAQAAIDQDASAGSYKAPDQVSLESLRQYLDKRFLELHRVVTDLQAASAIETASEIKVESALVATEQPLMGTTISFEVWNPREKIKQFRVNIEGSSSVQTVLDRCYFLIRGLVMVHTYLQSWIIVEIESGAKLVKERKERHEMLASQFFDPTRRYKIILLGPRRTEWVRSGLLSGRRAA